jgi:hypothetical protein
MLELLVFILSLIAAVLLMTFRPLAKSTGIPIHWEMGLGALVIISFCFYITTKHLAPIMIEKDLAQQPCGSGSPQGACYSLTRAVCEAAWLNAETTCKVEYSEVSKARPTALIGPTLNRCKARRMDQTLHFNRVHENSAYCRAYFDYIEEKL